MHRRNCKRIIQIRYCIMNVFRILLFLSHIFIIYSTAPQNKPSYDQKSTHYYYTGVCVYTHLF